MPGHCCCHCCYLCCFLVPSQISPLLLLLLRLILHLLDSRYCSLAPLSPACALPFLYRGCWIVSSSHGFTFPFLRKGLSYVYISFSVFFVFKIYIPYILEVSFLRQIWLLFLVTFARSFLIAHGWWYFSLSVLSDFLIFLFFFVTFSLCPFLNPLFFFSLTFLRFSTDIYSLYYLIFFLLISIFIIRIFLSSFRISLFLSLFFHWFLSSFLRYLSLFSIMSSPCRFFQASSYFFLYFSLSLIRFCFSLSHIWFLVSSSSKREVTLEVCFVSRTRASLEFLSLRSRRSRSTDSPHPSFLPVPPDDSGIRYNEFRSSYFQGNVIGDV